MTPPLPSAPTPNNAAPNVAVEYAPTEDEILAREQPDVARLLMEARNHTVTYAAGDGPSNISLVPAVSIGVGAFVVVGLFLWGGQRILNYAGGMRQGLSHGASREIGYVDPDSGNAARGGAPAFRSPAAPGSISSYRSASSSRNSAPLSVPHVGKGPFVGEAERTMAKRAMLPLHDVFQTVQHYNGVAGSGAFGSTFVAAFPSEARGGASGTAAQGLAPVTLTPGTSTGSGGALFVSGVSNTVTASRNAAAQADHVAMQTDALASQVSLVTHDEQYPEPLRPSMKELRKELHAFLLDSRLAAGDEQNRAALHTAASRRLTRAQSLLQYMDGIVAGGTDPNETPMP